MKTLEEKYGVYEPPEMEEKTEKSISFTISFTYDIKFWCTGAINLNFHNGEFELEFLCFGIYIGKL